MVSAAQTIHIANALNSAVNDTATVPTAENGLYFTKRNSLRHLQRVLERINTFSSFNRFRVLDMAPTISDDRNESVGVRRSRGRIVKQSVISFGECKLAIEMSACVL